MEMSVKASKAWLEINIQHREGEGSAEDRIYW